MQESLAAFTWTIHNVYRQGMCQSHMSQLTMFIYLLSHTRLRDHRHTRHQRTRARNYASCRCAGDSVRLMHVVPHVKEYLASGSVYYSPPLASEDFEYDTQMVGAHHTAHVSCFSCLLLSTPSYSESICRPVQHSSTSPGLL